MNLRSNRNGMPVVLLAAGLVSAWSCSWSAAAADMNSDSGTSGNATGFYESVDAGVSILQNMTSQIQGFSAGTFKFNVGPRIDASLGYNVTPNIAAELQAGFAYNRITRYGNFMNPPGLSSDLWTVPIMANGIYKYSFNDHWQAYGGLGAGAVFSTLAQRFSGEDVSSTDCTFGYQAMAGIKYLFTDHLECGLGYNFLGTLDHHWPQGLRWSPTYMHSILLSLTYKY